MSEPPPNSEGVCEQEKNRSELRDIPKTQIVLKLGSNFLEPKEKFVITY